MKPPGSFTDLEILTGTGGSFIPDDDFILFFFLWFFFYSEFFCLFSKNENWRFFDSDNFNFNFFSLALFLFRIFWLFFKERELAVL
jgi:hypothetical protein